MIASCLLLSVNMTGAQYPDTVDNRLARTTIFNREPDDPLLYLHTFLSFLLFPVAVYVMRQFSGGLDFQDAPVEVTHTLQIERIPHHMCNVCYMKRHFVDRSLRLPLRREERQKNQSRNQRPNNSGAADRPRTRTPPPLPAPTELLE